MKLLIAYAKDSIVHQFEVEALIESTDHTIVVFHSVLHVKALRRATMVRKIVHVQNGAQTKFIFI